MTADTQKKPDTGSPTTEQKRGEPSRIPRAISAGSITPASIRNFMIATLFAVLALSILFAVFVVGSNGSLRDENTSLKANVRERGESIVQIQNALRQREQEMRQRDQTARQLTACINDIITSVGPAHTNVMAVIRKYFPQARAPGEGAPATRPTAPSTNAPPVAP